MTTTPSQNNFGLILADPGAVQQEDGVGRHAAAKDHTADAEVALVDTDKVAESDVGRTIGAGRSDERGLPIFTSGNWSTEIKEVSDEAEKVIQNLKNCGGKVLFFRELRRTVMTKSPEYVIPKDEVKETSI